MLGKIIGKIIKIILCLIGGLPLLQTLAIVFSCTPIPFAKNGGFNFKESKFGKFLEKLKNFKKDLKTFFAENFTNPLRDSYQKNVLDPLNINFGSPLDNFNDWMDKYTANNYVGLQAALPGLFSNTEPSVATARTNLLNMIGKVQQNGDTYKAGPFSLGELINIAEESDSLARTMREMEQHTDNLSGLGGSGVVFEFARLYGNVLVTGANVNIASSIVVSPNLSQTVYPIVDIGDTVVINSLEKIVTNKNFTVAPTGTVSIDVSTDNVRVTTASVATLNLANCLLSTSGSITLNNRMFISVNNEVRQVNVINSLGDHLTVYNPFYSSASAQGFFKETSFNVNTAFSTTNTDLTIKVKSGFVCNSVCLDNVITGNGTSFTTHLQANNKIYYDNKEYFVISVTDTQIVVDDYLRKTGNYPVFKVINETPLLGLDEDLVDPDGIVNAFTLPGTISGDSNFLNGMTVQVRRANGIYQTASASKPTDCAQSLFQQELLRRTRRHLDQLKYDLRDEAIKGLTPAQLIDKLTDTKNRLKSVKEDVKNIYEQDLQVLNQVKNLVKGMIKLFSLSCSKKKRKDSGANDSDEYLDLILIPNPERQGCDATISDFIDILDDFDFDYNDPGFTNNPITANTSIIPNKALDDIDDIAGPFPRQGTGTVDSGNVGAGVDDQNPDVNVPEDPCAKPC